MRLALDLSLSSRASLAGAGQSYDPAAVAIFNAFTTPPDSARKTVINNCVVALKAGGVWDLLDILYFTAAADSQAARINWKTPGSFTLSPSNSPAFAADRGYTGDGATSSLVAGVLTSAILIGSQNSVCQFVWSRTDSNVANSFDVGVSNSNNLICAGRIGTTMSVRPNSTVASTPSTGDSIGHYGWSRSGASAGSVYKNGSSLTTFSSASAAFPGGNITVLSSAGGFSPRQISHMCMGANLSGAQVTALYNAVLAYLQAVGAA